MTYALNLFTLTQHLAKLSMQPESSDGFASVGTVLPKEEAALLPGGLFLIDWERLETEEGAAEEESSAKFCGMGRLPVE